MFGSTKRRNCDGDCRKTYDLYGHALSGPPPSPPWSMVQDAPPPVGWSVGSLFPLWGGCGGFGVLGLA